MSIPTIARFLFFVRSGYVDLFNTAGTLRNAGPLADYWSSRAVTTTAYDLHFDTAVVRPSNGPDYRWQGLSLRCLSTVLDM